MFAPESTCTIPVPAVIVPIVEEPEAPVNSVLPFPVSRLSVEGPVIAIAAPVSTSTVPVEVIDPLVDPLPAAVN